MFVFFKDTYFLATNVSKIFEYAKFISDITYRVMCNQGVRRISHPAETEINSCVVYSPESFPIFWEIAKRTTTYNISPLSRRI